MPAVSILVPTYNQARFLDAAIASARAQTFSDVEIVVLDNCSEDETPAVVARHAAEDGRVRSLRNEHNLGLVGNFNRALAVAAAPLVKFLCSDDLLEPQCVAVLRERLLAEPDIVLAACAREFIDDADRPAGRAGYGGPARTIAGNEVIRRTFFAGNLVGEPTAVLFRAADVRHGFDGRFHQLVDFEMWVRLLEQGRLAFEPQALCRVRRHHAQASAANLRSGRVLQERRWWFERYADRVVGATLRQRLEWDLRMAAAVARATHPVPAAEISEVFLPAFFRWCAVPAARTAVRLVGGAA